MPGVGEVMRVISSDCSLGVVLVVDDGKGGKRRETDRFITLPLSLELVFGAGALLGAEMVAAMIVSEW